MRQRAVRRGHRVLVEALAARRRATVVLAAVPAREAVLHIRDVRPRRLRRPGRSRRHCGGHRRLRLRRARRERDHAHPDARQARRRQRTHPAPSASRLVERGLAQLAARSARHRAPCAAASPWPGPTTSRRYGLVLERVAVLLGVALRGAQILGRRAPDRRTASPRRPSRRGTSPARGRSRTGCRAGCRCARGSSRPACPSR